MPPQPLSRVNSTTPVLFDPKAITERPQLAILVSRAIAGWSEAEGQMGYLLVRMLGANAEPALAMFSALTSAPAQIAVVRAAAEAVLDSERMEMVNAVLAIASPLATQRHRLAHQIWGYSEDLPEALILADSKDISQFWMKLFNAARQYAAGKRPPETDWPRDRLFVYRERDLTDIVAEMDELRDNFYQLSFLVEPGDPWRARILDYLNAKPRIQAALTRIRKPH